MKVTEKKVKEVKKVKETKVKKESTPKVTKKTKKPEVLISDTPQEFIQSIIVQDDVVNEVNNVETEVLPTMEEQLLRELNSLKADLSITDGYLKDKQEEVLSLQNTISDLKIDIERLNFKLENTDNFKIKIESQKDSYKTELNKVPKFIKFLYGIKY